MRTLSSLVGLHQCFWQDTSWTFSATNNPNGVSSAALPDAAVLVAEAETQLLASVVLRPHHFVRPLFPPVIIRRPGLRPHPHNFVLPDKDDCNFIPRIHTYTHTPTHLHTHAHTHTQLNDTLKPVPPSVDLLEPTTPLVFKPGPTTRQTRTHNTPSFKTRLIFPISLLNFCNWSRDNLGRRRHIKIYCTLTILQTGTFNYTCTWRL